MLRIIEAWSSDSGSPTPGPVKQRETLLDTLNIETVYIEAVYIETLNIEIVYTERLDMKTLNFF